MRVLRRLRPSYAQRHRDAGALHRPGGASYAAFAVPKNSIGARELERKSVTGTEVGNSSLHARKLRVGSRPARVHYARVRRGGVDGEITLDGARGVCVTFGGICAVL